MDLDTFENIIELRRQAQEAADEHEPETDEEPNEATPEERFKALGRFVMSNDEFPSRKEFGGKQYVEHAFLPGGVTVLLVAETSPLADRPTVDDLVTVKAEWSVGSVDHPMHVDSVSNISDSHRVDEAELKSLALVEESFAEARQHIAA